MESVILSPIPFDQLTRIINDAVRKEVGEFAATYIPAAATPPTSDYLTRKEIAAKFGISLPTLHDWTTTGKLRGYRIGSRVRYKASEIDEALKAIVTSRKH